MYFILIIDKDRNKLRYINAKLFSGLTKLTTVNLGNNECISQDFYDPSTLALLNRPETFSKCNLSDLETPIQSTTNTPTQPTTYRTIQTTIIPSKKEVCPIDKQLREIGNANLELVLEGQKRQTIELQASMNTEIEATANITTQRLIDIINLITQEHEAYKSKIALLEIELKQKEIEDLNEKCNRAVDA